MRLKPLTPYGESVRLELIRKGWSVSYLSDLVRDDTGMFCSTQYLSHIFVGDRNPPKIIASINKILQLEDSTQNQD